MSLDPSDLPKVVIISTGGTIAASLPGTSVKPNFENVCKAMPGLDKKVVLEFNTFNDVVSTRIDTRQGLDLRKLVKRYLVRDDIDGVVITHGTDSLEETAFLLDVTVSSHKPVVFTGAMRKPYKISADGPANLYNSILVAGSKESQKRGVLVCMNDRIISAYYATKTDPTTLDSFQSHPNSGFLGQIVSERPVFYFEPALPTHKPFFHPMDGVDCLPHVTILYAYQDSELDTYMIQQAIDKGTKGIVLASYASAGSNGSIMAALLSAAEQGVPVVLSSRSNNGLKPEYNVDGFVSAARFSPQKAKILLQLTLAKYTHNEVEAVLKKLFR